MSKISFPGLGIDSFSVNSQVSFGGKPLEIFGMSIAWYAVFITLGMILCVCYIIFMSKKIGITSEDVIDFALFVIPIGIVGARLYYVLSEIEHYDSFKDVINIREGGLAIYGGIIAGGLTVLVMCYIKKINFLAFADCVSPGVILAQAVGRWGNFMNGEAFGAETDIFIRMGLKNVVTLRTFGTTEMVYVHPTFLYESLWNLLGFALVNVYAKFVGKKYDGQLFLFVFGWYGLGRMFIELLRTDSLYLGNTNIRISSLLGGVIFVITLGFLIYFAIKKPTKKLYYRSTKNEKATKKK